MDIATRKVIKNILKKILKIEQYGQTGKPF